MINALLDIVFEATKETHVINAMTKIMENNITSQKMLNIVAMA